MPITRLNIESGYTKLSNEYVHQNSNLSFPARGLLGYLLSKGDGWKFYKCKIIEDSGKTPSGKPKMGLAALDTVLEELEINGHIKIVKDRMEDGTFDGYTWDIYEKPIDVGPHNIPENPPEIAKPRQVELFPVCEQLCEQPVNKQDSTGEDYPISVNPQLEIKELIQERKEYIYTPEFIRYWKIFPKKASKPAAFDKFKSLVKSGVNPEDIIAGAERYASYCKSMKTENHFIKWPTGWLNAREERWKLAYTIPAAPVRRGLISDSMAPKSKQDIIIEQVKEFGSQAQREYFFKYIAQSMEWYRNAQPTIHQFLEKLDRREFGE